MTSDQQAYKSHFLLALIVTLVATGCGQGPSFIENASKRESGDVIGAAGRGEADSGLSTESAGSKADGEADGSYDGPVEGGADEGGLDEAPGGDDEGPTDDNGGDGSGDGGTGDAGSDDAGADGSADGSATAGNDGGVVLPTPPPSPPPVQIQRAQSFPTEVLGSANVNANLDDPYLGQDLIMQRSYQDKSRAYSQIVRPGINDRFTQGHAGTPRTDNFIQSASKPLDILVVVDNSGSMAEEQVNLSTKLSPLLSYISGVDWKIGVVTTDPSDGCLEDVIVKGDADAESDFAKAVKQGTKGSGNERGVLQAVNGLKCDKPSWVRAESTIAVLIVSDEDNCSNGNGCSSQPYASKDYLLNHLNQIRIAGVNARVFGLFRHPSQQQSDCSTARNTANIYSQIVADTGGTWGSICDADYSTTLATISQNISTILQRKFTLSQVPDPGSLVVRINGVEQLSGYTVTGNQLVFDVAPADGDAIEISYAFGAQPIRTTFALTQPADITTIMVKVNGVPVSDMDYEHDPATNKINFAAAPDDRGIIDITYIKDVPLTNAFAIGDPWVDGTLTVFVNNVETTDYMLVNNDSAVTFAEPPVEGSSIVLNYTAVGNAILSYPFTVDGKAPQKLRVTDKATMQPVFYIYLLGTLSFLGSDWQEGRELLVEYWNEGRDFTEVMLPTAPIASTISATGGNIKCDANYITVQGQTAVVRDCGFPVDVDMIRVDYDFVMQRLTMFEFTDPEIRNAPEPKTWRVLINGQITYNYTLDEANYTVTFPMQLPVGSTVTIEVSFQRQM